LDILKQTIGHNYDEQPYLKLFLHNRLTKFDLSLVKPTSQLAAIKILLERCDKIKELVITDVNNVAFQDCQLALLSINFIKELSFNDKSFSSLVIPCCCITKNLFELLVNFKSLKKLSLMLPVNLDLDTLTILISSLTMLQELSLIPSAIDFENFTGDVKFNNILNLNISSTKVSDEGLSNIVRKMPNLASLALCHCKQLTVECFNHISKLENLSSLNVSFIKLFEPCMIEIVERFLMKQGLKLKKLDLSGIDYLNLNLLARCCPDLEELNLQGCQHFKITWIKKSELMANREHTKFNHLKPFKKENYSLVEVFHRLQTFYFSWNCHVTREQLQMFFRGNENSIRNLKLLFYVQDDDCYITTYFFNTFYFKNLKNLSIIYNGFLPVADVYAIIRSYPYLNQLDLQGCVLDIQDIEDIEDIIYETKSKINILFQE